MNPSTSAIISALQELPTSIKRKQLEILQLNDGISVMELNIAQYKNKALLEVSQEKTGDKPRYTNAEMRNAAVEERLGSDKYYGVFVNELQHSKNVLKQAQIELEWLNNTLSSTKKMADLFCSGD